MVFVSEKDELGKRGGFGVGNPIRRELCTSEKQGFVLPKGYLLLKMGREIEELETNTYGLPVRSLFDFWEWMDAQISGQYNKPLNLVEALDNVRQGKAV